MDAERSTRFRIASAVLIEQACEAKGRRDPGSRICEEFVGASVIARDITLAAKAEAALP
jgi:hypothetical protein